MTGETDGGALRTVIWKNAIELFFNSPILGVGAGSTLPAFVDAGYLRAVTHNFYLALLLEYGILGSMLFFILLIRILKEIQLRNNRFEVAAFWGTMAAALFLDTLTTKFFWGMLILLVIRTNLLEQIGRASCRETV